MTGSQTSGGGGGQEGKKQGALRPGRRRRSRPTTRSPISSQTVPILRTAMRILGLRNSDISRRLGWTAAYVSRFLSGHVELRVHQVADIGQALGLRPDEIFRIAFPEPQDPPTEA